MCVKRGKAMELNLLQCFESDGREYPFSCTLDLSAYPLGGEFPFASDVSCVGRVQKKAGVLWLEADVKTTLSLQCDRCLTRFDRAFCEHISHRIARGDPAQSDETIYVANDRLDLRELVYADVLFLLPTKILCQSDCKGLCPVCGANRNIEDCPHGV